MWTHHRHCHFVRHENFAWEDHRPATGTWKGTAGGNVYSFSGCDDHQTVFDSMVSISLEPNDRPKNQWNVFEWD